jgi:hypothetical protein
MSEQPEQTADEVAAVGVPAERRPGPLARVGALARKPPVVLVAAAAAGFLLGRLLKRAIRR